MGNESNDVQYEVERGRVMEAIMGGSWDQG